MNCKLFTSTAHVTQWSNYLTQRAEILTRRSNFTPQRAKKTVNDLSVVSAVPKSLVGFTVSSLFFPRPASCSRQFTLNRSNFGQHFTDAEYTEKKRMISWRRTWSISWHLPSRIGKIAHIVKPKHIKISCLPQESSLNHSRPSWILPQAIRDIHLSCPWFLSCAIARNRSIFPRAFLGTPECPDIKNTIDCACLQSYIRQILPSSRYYKE